LDARNPLGSVGGCHPVGTDFQQDAGLCPDCGSGGAGGAFGPSLFVGASLGAGRAAVFGQSPAAAAIAGVVAVLGVTARVPVAGIIMTTELTHTLAMFVPAAWRSGSQPGSKSPCRSARRRAALPCVAPWSRY